MPQANTIRVMPMLRSDHHARPSPRSPESPRRRASVRSPSSSMATFSTGGPPSATVSGSMPHCLNCFAQDAQFSLPGQRPVGHAAADDGPEILRRPRRRASPRRTFADHRARSSVPCSRLTASRVRHLGRLRGQIVESPPGRGDRLEILACAHRLATGGPFLGLGTGTRYLARRSIRGSSALAGLPRRVIPQLAAWPN